MTMLVTGSTGQLGSAVVRLFRDDHDVVALQRQELDLTDPNAIRQVVARLRPSLVVNCAAYNHVDAAETDPVTALQVNALAVRAFARAAARIEATFVHYGSDFVFDGTATRPYREDDPPNPRSVYAASKLLGDWFAADAPRHYVLRVESLFGGARRKSTIDGIIDRIATSQEVRVFIDRTVSPSYVDDVARATRSLIERNAPWGLYHCVNSGLCTWWELAEEAARLLGVAPRLVPMRVPEVTLPAERPQFCALSNAKLAAQGVTMPAWQDALARDIAQRRTGGPS